MPILTMNSPFPLNCLTYNYVRVISNFAKGLSNLTQKSLTTEIVNKVNYLRRLTCKAYNLSTQNNSLYTMDWHNKTSQ